MTAMPDTPAPVSHEVHTETAAQHMIESIPTGVPKSTVGAILAELAAGKFSSVHAVYVLDSQERLLGVVPMAALLGSGMQHRLEEIMAKPATTVAPGDDQELVAAAAIEHSISDVPVTDGKGRLLGVVPAQALLKIQRGEFIEDMNRLAGILRSNDQARTAMEGGTQVSRAWRRLPWLVIGLVGGGIATWLMAAFEAELQRRIAVAFFVPAIVYLAGAVGSQSVAITVRWLSLGEPNLRYLTISELLTGMIIGVVLAALSFFPIAWLLNDVWLATAVCLSLIVASSLSTTIGLLLPWSLWKFGRDPALGAGPMATIVQDILSLLAYFWIVSWLL